MKFRAHRALGVTRCDGIFSDLKATLLLTATDNAHTGIQCFFVTGLVGLALALNNAHADQFLISNRGSISSKTMFIAHESGAIESGTLGIDDSSWSSSIPSPTQPEMKVTTNPYGTELRRDARPLDSETLFHAELSAVDRTSSSTLINTSTNYVKIAVDSGGTLDTNRLYIGKFHRDAQWNPSGLDFDYFTNIVTALGGIEIGKNFDIGSTAITNNLPSSTVYGTLDVSCKFTNQFFTLGNKSSITNDLSENQVSGLEYVLTSGTNVNGDAHIENGTNLVFAPSSSFVGTNDVNARLKWNGSDLGDINYQFNVTNQIIPPAITSQPQSQFVTLGSNATFTVTADGTAPLIYQWRFNGTNIGSATSTAYTKTNAQSADAGSYSVIVTNDGGSVTSSVATLVVNVPPSITSPPQTQFVTPGGDATFTVTADGTAPLSYQWRFNGTNISSATLSRYTRTNAQTNDAGSYLVVVTNVAGSATSSVAMLIILPTNAFATITGPGFSTGRQFRLTVTGMADSNYVVQASTNLAPGNWISLHTNVSPFSFTDAVSVLHFQRYYRAVILP